MLFFIYVLFTDIDFNEIQPFIEFYTILISTLKWLDLNNDTIVL